MPSAPIYIERRGYKRCPRCGRRTRKCRSKVKPATVPVLCELHQKLAADEKRLEYQAKAVLKVCVWSGCHKQAAPNRRMCKGHLTDNRILTAERKKRAKVQKLQQGL